MTSQYDLIAIALNDRELLELKFRLSSIGHRFFEVGHTFGRVALSRTAADPELIGDDFDRAMWAERERYVDAMDEMHAMADELRTLTAVREPVTADA